MALSEKLLGHFPGDVRMRGTQYFGAKRVRFKSGNDRQVVAVVQGHQKYRLRISLEDGSVVVYCNCPYYSDVGACKHLWATILEADRLGYLNAYNPRTTVQLIEEGDEAAEDRIEEEEEAILFTSKAPGVRPQHGNQLQSWKTQLQSIGQSSQPKWSSTCRLIYVIDVQRTLTEQRLIVHLLMQERKVDGQWRKPRKPVMKRSQIATLPDPADRQILALLSGSRDQADYGSYYYYQNSYDSVTSLFSLLWPLPRMVLPLMAESGRCFIQANPYDENPPPIEWDAGEPWQFLLRIRRNLERPLHYEVKGFFYRGQEELNMEKPLLLLQGGLLFTGERVALLEDVNVFQWISLLRRSGSLQVPEKEIGQFLTQMFSKADPPQLDLPAEIAYEEIRTKPEPVLKFKKRRYADRPAGQLVFQYSPDCNAAETDLRQFLFAGNSGKCFFRNKEFEEAAKQRLRDLGFRFSSGNYGEPSVWEVRPTHFSRAVRLLTDEGWRIEAEGKIFRNPGNFKIQVTTGIDWFELHGSVDYGDTTAELPELLAALKRGDNTVLLDDGTYGMLPETWLQKYGMIAALGEQHADHLRFKKTQVGVLDALLSAQSEANFDETFARARQEILRFEGIQPLEPPSEFNGELRPYQKEGLGWMQFLRGFGFGGCLADDMGLGKTVTVLALLEERRKLRTQQKEKPQPSLVIVPKSLVFNWKLEAGRFAPKLNLLDYTGVLRSDSNSHFGDYDVIITTYGILRNDAVLFKDTPFDYIILDEAQAIKNADSISAKAARLLQSNHKLVLSGTPVQNHLGDLWSLFEFLNPGMLGASSVLKLNGSMARNPDEETIRVLGRALRPFILRRTKDKVAAELPAKLEQTIYCEMEGRQRRLYDELRNHYRNSLMTKVDSEGMAKSKILVLEALLRLRQAACHPALIDKQRIQEPSAKLEMVLPQIKAVLEEDHKILVFSQFTSFLAIFRHHLDKDGVRYEYLDGKTRDRQARVETFQNDPACKLFLISLKAGGLGLNLTAAEYVYLLDPWWNPVIEAQAIDRAHRIGQTRGVFAYRIITRDTVEEKVLQLQDSKRRLADSIINSDNSLIRSLVREDLELLLS